MPAKSKSAKKKFAEAYSKISNKVTRATGSPIASFCAFAIIIIWALTGPLFNYSDTWQLVINTSTTIITFLMVFIIQQSQNKDTSAMQLKLNELIATNSKANNRLIDIEDLTEEELMTVKKFYVKLAKLAEKESDVCTSHSLSEADELHTNKLESRKRKVAKPKPADN